MPPSSPSTPARLTASATAKLPRAILFILPLLYIAAGLFMRDPWKNEDAVGLATMITAIREGSIAWLVPQVGPLAHAQEGPLITWAGGASIWLFGPLMGEITSGRLPNLAWFALTCAALWYGTYLVGRLKSAQPLALPFGGEPSPRDYGRMLADAALLLLVATVGILRPAHETSTAPALLACHALAFYGWARTLDRPLSGTLTLALALAMSFFARGWAGLLPVMAATLILFAPGAPLWHRWKWLLLTAALTAGAILAWWLAAGTANEYWTRNWKLWSRGQFGGLEVDSSARALRDLAWYLWPTWPLALVAAWRWRAWLRAPHLAFACALLVCGLLTLVATNRPTQDDFIGLALPCAILAAMALPTLRRGIVNTLDWFAIMVFSLTAAAAWLGWVALHFGWPPKIANNIARQTTGFVPEIAWIPVLLALFLSAAWVAVVIWRLRMRPLALWRGTVLSACGLTVTWVLLSLLWMPAVDYARSYRTASHDLAQAIRANVGPNECTRALGLGPGQRASFLIFDNLTFSYDSKCSIVLQQTSRRAMRDGVHAYRDTGNVIWEGGRLADRDEWFRLLRLSQ